MSKKSENVNIGTLYVVGTPIGNLKDITIRAIETLEKVDIILAEDTRQTLKLLNRYNISKKLLSYHKFNETERIEQIIKMLESGNNIALVSDAGMPRISDPGESLIKIVIDKDMKVEVIPGPTALTTAIVYSNIDASTFTFEGFLDVNSKKRKQRLEMLKYETRLMIFYEAPHKLLTTLKDLYKGLGDRKICIARELTKLHEECIYSSLSEMIERLEDKPLKGEIVLLVEGDKEGSSLRESLRNESDNNELSNVELVKKYIEQGVQKKEAIKKVAKKRDLDKNTVYMECVENDK